MRRVDQTLVVVFFAVVSISSAIATDIKDHWKRTAMTMKRASNYLEPETCYQNERTMVGCGFALDAMLGLRKPTGLRILPQTEYAKVPGAPKPTESIGDLIVFEVEKSKEKSFAKRLSRIRQERAARVATWTKFYNDTKDKPVDFKPVIDLVAGKNYWGEDEHYVAAQIVNTWLSVTQDPHTSFLPTSYIDEELNGQNHSVVGVGIHVKTMEEDGKTTVVIVAPSEDGPAHQAGIRAKDILTHIDGTPIGSSELDDLIKKIRGEAGTKVKLTILRGEKTLEFELTRKRIDLPNVKSKTVAYSGRKVGYLRLRDFMDRKSCADLTEAVRRVEADKPHALVLDLRQNGGGLIDQAQCISNIFLNKGDLIVSARSMSGQVVENYVAENEKVTDLPLLTWIDGGSASASEITAGALQDYRRSLIVGSRSFGKGTVQKLRGEFATNLIYKYTVSRFYLPSGRTNQIVGINPDIAADSVPDSTEDDKASWREEDEYLALPPVNKPWQQPEPELMARIQKCADAGKAKERFEAAKNDVFPPDYGLMYATEVAECWAKENYSLGAIR